MENESRTKKTLRNITVGIISKIILIILPFINRTIIIWFLGAQYLGIRSLYTSILEVLNLSELGLSIAVVYSMYGLIAQSDTDRICELLNYFRRTYIWISVVIFVAGLVILPALPWLISGEYSSDINIYILFLIYLFQTISSYIVVGYKGVILNAYQRMDIASGVQMLTLVGQQILQFVVLMLIKNYYAYAIVAPIFTIANNLMISYICKRMYPELTCCGKISAEMKSKLNKQISGLLIDRMSVAIRNSSDNIVISAMFGLTVLSKYSNYYYIMFTGVYGTLLFLIQAIQASVGDSIARESQEKNYHDFINFNFLFAWLNVCSVTCMYALFQPFISIWIGAENLLARHEMILFCVYGYLFNVCSPINPYFDGNGLWEKVKKSILVCTILNIVLNVILGKIIGISGIIISTVICLIIPYIFGRIHIIYKHYFKDYRESDYYARQAIYLLATVISCVLVSIIISLINISNSVNGLLIRFFICVLVSSITMFTLLNKTHDYEVGKEFIKTHIFLRGRKKI